MTVSSYLPSLLKNKSTCLLKIIAFLRNGRANNRSVENISAQKLEKFRTPEALNSSVRVGSHASRDVN